ncbi:MAG TPA: LLM class flavin-dependent oxidoreductase [Stellaceae bacterium]|nr:LLM class flavin-dependent oxidoreductase [Stellaceae bacterium]
MRLAIWGHTAPREGLSHTQIYHQQLDDIVLAEECGFDHYWLYEHHVSPHSCMPSPNLMIAAAARATKRIRLGTMVNILPYRHPLLVAEEMAMLDVLTNGRIDVGIGRGLKPLEFRAFGVEQDRSREMFNESLDLILKVWADKDFVHSGKYFKIEKRTPLSPPLVQHPHPPLYISAQSRDSLRWAAENDIPFGQIDALIEDCQRDQEYYREVQKASGHPLRPRLFLTREVYVGESDAAAIREMKPYLMQHWDLWNRYTQFTNKGEMPDSYDVWRQRAPVLHALEFDELVERGLVIAGTPETVARRIREHQEALDLHILLCVFDFGVMPNAMMRRSMRAFSQYVMPLLAETATQGS